MSEITKFLVPILMVVYAESESEASFVTERAIDTSDIIKEDGIFSIEVIESGVDLLEET